MSKIEIHKSILDNISNDYEKTAGYPIYDITSAIAIALADERDLIDKVASKIDVNNLDDEELGRFVKQRKGIIRKPAKAATGILNIIGTGVINIGSLFETENGVQFSATETKAITGIGIITIGAVKDGNIGVVGANSITLMPITIPGIISCNNSSATIDGYEKESDESLRDRYDIALQTPPTSGNIYHYKQWAQEVVGNGGARVFSLARGNNTVDVVIIDDNGQPANTSLIERTQEYIDPLSKGTGAGQAPIGAYCYVSSATAKSVSIYVKLTLDNTAIAEVAKNTISEKIKEYLKSIAFISNIVSLAKIGDLILDVPGVVDYEGLKLNNGMANISVGEREIAILGVITYA